MATRTVLVTLTGDASSLIAAAQRARESLNQLGNTDTSRVGAGFRSSSDAAREMGTTTTSVFDKMKSGMAAQVGIGNLMAMGVMSAFFAIKTAITDTISAGVDYQTTMFTLQAVTHASGDTMVDVGQKARDLGKDMTIPGASATDAAKAMTELAKGSLSVADAMTAAKGTLQLAAAAGVDASRAAEIQVNTLNAYHLAADQAGHVADVLANAANQASGEMTDFADGLVKVEATAHGFGIGLEDTTTILGLFANAGIKGSEGGTTFNTMLTHLAAPTKPAADAIKTLGLTVFDAAGNFEGMHAVVDQLRTAHEKLTPAVYDNAASIAFGTRGIRGAMILGAEAAGAYDNMSTALTHEGGAAELAGAKMQGLGGAFQNLQNQVQDAQLAVFDNVAPGLTAMVNAFAGGIPVLIDAAMGGIGVITSKVGELLAPVVDGIKQLFASANTSTALHMLGTDLMAVGSAAVAVFGALQPLTDLIGKALGWFSELPAPVQAAAFAFGALILLQGPLAGLILSIKTGFQIVGYEAATMAERVAAAGGVMSFSMDAVGVAAKGMWTAMGGWVGLGIAAIVGLFSLFSGGADTATVAVTDLSDAVDTNTGKLKDNAQQILATLLANDGSLATYQSIGGAVTDYTAALTGNTAAQETVHTKLLDVATAAVESSKGWQQNQVALENSGKTARGTASDILAGADASWLGADAATGQALSIGAVVTANANFAAESDNLAAKQATATLAIQAAGTAAGGTAGAVSTAAGATQQLGNDAANAVDPVTLMDTGLKELKASASAADTAAQFLSISLIQMAGGAVTSEAATRANEAAFRAIADAMQTVNDKQTAVTDAVNKYGADSPQAAAATRDLAAAQDGLATSQDKAGVSASTMASAAYSAKAANGDLEGAVVAASAVMQDQRDKFIAAAVAAGSTAEQAAALADKEGLIPKNVTTIFNAENLATQSAQVTDLNNKLNAINGAAYHYSIIGDQIVTRPNDPMATLGHAVMQAEGGIVTGPGGPTADRVPIMASAGEFVVNAAQTTKYRGLLESINNSAAGFARGGLVGFAAGGAVTTAPDTTAATAAAPAAATPDAPAMLPDSAAIGKAWTDIASAITAAWTTSILPTFDLLDQRTAQVGAEFTALDKRMPRWVGPDADPTTEPPSAVKQSTADPAAAANTVRARTVAAAQGTSPATGDVAGGSVQQDLAAVTALATGISSIPKGVTTTFTGEGLTVERTQVADLSAELDAMNGETYRYTIVGDQTTGTPDQTNPPAASPVVRGAGGPIVGRGTGTSDSIMARVSNGEWIVPASAAKQHMGVLKAITPGFARGGLVGGYVAGGPVTIPADTAAAPPAAAPADAPAMLPDSAAIAAAWADIAAAITTSWTTLILPVFDSLDARTIQVGVEFGLLDTDQTTPAWTDIAATIANQWGGVIAPTYGAINAGTQDVGAQWWFLAASTNQTSWNMIGQTIWDTWGGTINPTYAAINAGTQNVGYTIQSTWASVIYPTFNAINDAANNVGATWWNLAGTTAAAWAQIGGSITSTYNGQIVPAWSGVQGFANATGGFFAGIAGGMNSADATTTADLSQIQGAIDNFFAMVDAKAPVPKLADGGIITQGSGPRADDVTVRVSRGEYVVNAEATARHKDQLDAINNGGYADGGIVGFADGGLIGDKIGNRVENAVVGGVERAFDAGVTRILASVAATISGYTPGSVEGTRGKFLDAVASKMGTAYVWGAAGPDVFDCSGLMSWALEQAGAGVGRLTADQFNTGFPHIPESSVVPGDLVTFDTGRIPGSAGHIGAVMDVTKHLMMNTDGSGPAAVADYEHRDGGPLSFVDPIGGTYTPHKAAAGKPGDPPSVGWLADILSRIAAGGTGPAAASTTPAPTSGGVEQWRATVIQALALTGQPANLADIVLHQMDTESSGNAAAINQTDSNAQRGTPSEGLMQVIQPTFDSYALAPYNQNIWDPLSNIIAAIRYVLGAYGGVAAGMQGHAYATGGIVGADGKKKPDTVPAWLSPGEAVISQMPGTEKANKGYLDTAASWFGGNVTYPDTKTLPPNLSGMSIQVQAPPVNVQARLFLGSQDITDLVRVEIDHGFSDFASEVTRQKVQSR